MAGPFLPKDRGQDEPAGLKHWRDRDGRRVRSRCQSATWSQRTGRTVRMFEQGAIRRCLGRSEEHTSELQSLMRISYAVFCLKKKIHYKNNQQRVYRDTYNPT